LNEIADLNVSLPEMPAYTLHYFNLRARGELIRWLFEYSGTPFEDHRIAFEEWPAIKPNTPYGNLPYLEVDGKPLAQSLAIARLLARRFKLAGANDWEQALIDEIVEYVRDAAAGYTSWISAFMAKNEELAKSIKEEYTSKGVIPFLQGLEKKLNANNGGKGYFVGSGPTLADFSVTVFFDEVRRLAPNILDSYPALKAHSDRVHGLRGIKEWVAKRPDSPF
jgi:glutathione S-transferase